MKFTLLALITLTLSTQLLACSEDGSTGFVPENNIRIPVGTKTGGGLTEAQFHAAVKRVEVLYAPVIANLGAKLVINKAWKDDEANAFAKREGRNWLVHMTGGLARHAAMTMDGFSLVVCHEIGHHIGGAPKKRMGNAWSSAEGQADYWGTLKCLRKVFLNDDNARIVRSMNVPVAVKMACTRSHGSSPERDLCIRMSMAGAALGTFFQMMGEEKKISFATPDKNIVKMTYEKHPAAQCRLDTYFQGALCEKSMNEAVSQTDEWKGTCHRMLGDSMGLRPTCWFRSRM